MALEKSGDHLHGAGQTFPLEGQEKSTRCRHQGRERYVPVSYSGPW